MLRSLLTFTILTFSFAVSQVKAITNAPVEALDQLIIEKKYDEAKQLSVNTFQQREWDNKITNSAKCIPAIEKCENVVNKLNDVRSCIYEIALNCQGRDNAVYNYSPTTAKRLEKTYNSLIEKNEDLPLNKSAEQEKLCVPSMRWGYTKDKACGQCARTIKIDLSKLHGKFITKDTCEESRLLEDTSIDTGKSCLQRYLGTEITIDRYELIAMNNAKKTILKFDNKVECEDALKNGYVYFDEDFQKHFFTQLGSTGGSKIIGNCITKKTVICENNK